MEPHCQHTCDMLRVMDFIFHPFVLSSAPMGSIRKTSWKNYAVFLLLNVIVSAITITAVLMIWDWRNPPPQAPSTPTIDIAARVASAVPSETPTIPPTPTPVTYTVGPGDTLGAIAVELDISMEALMAANGIRDPNALSVGQVLIVPSVEESAALEATGLPPTATVGPTQTPNPAAASPKVVIRGAYGRGNLETEYVYLQNVGGVANMEGWSMEDGEGNVYQFPQFTLYNDGGVNVYTKDGADSVINLYWGMDEAIWTPGKRITLRDSEGTVHSTFQIPSS